MKTKGRQILDALSGVWSFIDGFGNLVVLIGTVIVAVKTGIWGIAIAVIVWQALSILNSFYVSHRLTAS